MNLAIRRSSVVAAVAAGLVLTGCTVGPSPAPTPTPVADSPTPSPTPTVQPIDPLTTVTEIVVRPEELELHDSEGVVVATLSYDADAADIISTLSIVLAAEPTQTETGGGLEARPATQYLWEGIRVWDDDDTVELGGPKEMNVSMHFTAPTVGDGVAVRTVNGFQPGGDAQALAAELGEPWYGNGQDQVRVETGEPIGEQQPGNDYENAYSVSVNAVEWQGTSNSLFAPWNFGIGHV